MTSQIERPTMSSVDPSIFFSELSGLSIREDHAPLCVEGEEPVGDCLQRGRELLAGLAFVRNRERASSSDRGQIADRDRVLGFLLREGRTRT